MNHNIFYECCIFYNNCYNEVDKDSVVYLKQDYVITQNYTNDYTFDGTWLRLYFYKYNSSYSLDLNDIGTLTINTCPIEFTYGLKAHDETNIDAVATGNVFETIDDMTKITLNNNGTAKTPNISAHDYNLDEISVNVNEKEYVGIDGTKATFWVYSSNKSNETVVDYVILSTRLYFPSNPTTQEDNFYNAYSFLLTIEPINQAELMSSHLEKMVNTFEHGVIISPENNNRFIYMMFEVRELLTIEMSVAKLDNDDNSTLRTTTLSNGTNNSATLTLTPGATSKTNAATLFETNAEITTYETKKTAYTYVGAINNVYSDFNTAHYARVEYILNNNPTPISNTFDVSENSSLLIKFIPASLNLRYVYTLNGEEITNSEQIGEYIKEGETNSSTAIDYVLGESIMYSAECVDIDYNVNVVINNNSAIENGTTNYTERKVNVVYEITASDFTFGEILVQVNIVLRDNSKIKISYKLNDATKGFADDVYGTFNVYELNKDGEKKIAENVSEVEVSIFDQSSVSVELNINAGYQYESIKYARQDAQKLEIGADGRINIITNYNPETNSGEYVIFISKIPITAVLSTAGTNAKSAYLINNKKALEGLWVGQTIAFTSEPAIQERLDYFYYKAGGNEIPLKDSAGAPLMEVRITSDLLKEVNSTIIDFGVKVVNQYKLTLKVDDDSLQNIAENGLQLKNKTTGETYVAEGAHAYVDANTQITISVQTREPSKYNIDLTMTKPENRENIGSNVVEWKDKEAINEGDVVITLNQDYEYTLVVEPNQYQVIVEENLFNSLDEVFNNNPQEVSAADQVNEITSKGQKYNEEAEISFIKQTEDRELSAIYISNNGNSEIIIIEFNSDNYIAYKIVEDGKQTIRLSDYGYAIELSEDRVIMKYVTYNNIEIRFDYKSYKLIHA